MTDTPLGLGMRRATTLVTPDDLQVFADVFTQFCKVAPLDPPTVVITDRPLAVNPWEEAAARWSTDAWEAIGDVLRRAYVEECERDEVEVFAVLLFIALGCDLPLWRVVAVAAIEGRR